MVTSRKSGKKAFSGGGQGQKEGQGDRRELPNLGPLRGQVRASSGVPELVGNHGVLKAQLQARASQPSQIQLDYDGIYPNFNGIKSIFAQVPPADEQTTNLTSHKHISAINEKYINEIEEARLQLFFLGYDLTCMFMTESIYTDDKADDNASGGGRRRKQRGGGKLLNLFKCCFGMTSTKVAPVNLTQKLLDQTPLLGQSVWQVKQEKAKKILDGLQSLYVVIPDNTHIAVVQKVVNKAPTSLPPIGHVSDTPISGKSDAQLLVDAINTFRTVIKYEKSFSAKSLNFGEGQSSLNLAVIETSTSTFAFSVRKADDNKVKFLLNVNNNEYNEDDFDDLIEEMCLVAHNISTATFNQEAYKGKSAKIGQLENIITEIKQIAEEKDAKLQTLVTEMPKDIVNAPQEPQLPLPGLIPESTIGSITKSIQKIENVSTSYTFAGIVSQFIVMPLVLRSKQQ